MKWILPLLLFASVNLNCQNLKPKEPVLHYLIREPKIKSGKPPVIILMHGIRSNERDLFSFADLLPAQFLVVSARAPYSLGNDGYAWYHADFSTDTPVINAEEAEKSRAVVIQFINELKAVHPFDETKVYLCGFSQGAIMSYSVGLTHPELVKGIAVMSGRVLEEVKPKVVKNKVLKKLSVFISHGINDNVIKVQNARNAKTYLESLGISPTYKEYTEVHSINNDMLTDLVNWLSKK